MVSTIAWAGIPLPLVDLIDSLFQGRLPEVTSEHTEMLDCTLARLLQECAALCSCHECSLREASKLRIIMLADSSLANSRKYSQRMFHVFSCHKDIILIIGCTDCHDPHEGLCSPASLTGITNKAMMLYTTELRELRSIGRVEQRCWTDKRDEFAVPDQIPLHIADLNTMFLSEPHSQTAVFTFVWKLKRRLSCR